MAYFVDPDIEKTTRVFPMQGRYDYLRYDMNENPEGLPADFVREVAAEITPAFLSTYPEPDRFLRKYAAYLGVKPENVTVTNGSDHAIRYVFETFAAKGDEVVTVSPTFEMYWVNCMILGLKHVPVLYRDDLTIDTEDVLAAISEKTRIVCILNPNNPVGDAFSEEDFDRIRAKAEAVGAVVLVDEAYHYFYEKTFLPHIAKGNVIVLRTFSKLFSMAALRLGVIIAAPKIIHYINNLKLTFEVNSAALLFGERILDRPDIIGELIREEKEGKAYALADLQAHGYSTRECKGNYIFIETRQDALTVTRRLQDEKKVLVHGYKSALLGKYIRVSVGSKAAMARFLPLFYDVDR